MPVERVTRRVTPVDTDSGRQYVVPGRCGWFQQRVAHTRTDAYQCLPERDSVTGWIVRRIGEVPWRRLPDGGAGVNPTRGISNRR